MPKKVKQSDIGPTSPQQPNIVDGAKRKVKSKTKPSSAKKEAKPKTKPSSAKKVQQDGGLFGIFNRKLQHKDGDKQYYYIDFEQDSTIVNEAIKKNYTDLSEINEYLNKSYSELEKILLEIEYEINI